MKRKVFLRWFLLMVALFTTFVVLLLTGVVQAVFSTGVEAAIVIGIGTCSGRNF